MTEPDQMSKIASIAVVLLAAVLGYGYIHGSLDNPRPPSTTVSQQIPDPAGLHRVESRLWQDPFECFESATNSAPSDENKNECFASEVDSITNGHTCCLWDELTHRHPANMHTVVLGVMLEGGPYADEKEVRLRTRYAIEVALLTAEFGPTDRTHIYTNWMQLTSDCTNVGTVDSTYSYEWFRTSNETNDSQICVVWLNEDDFADNPRLRLGSLIGQIPALALSQTNTSFYLIGPRSSDTLQALANPDTIGCSTNYDNLVAAATNKNFQILSPEATACVGADNLGDTNDQFVKNELTNVFHADIFHNWIATDQQIASLITKELESRINGKVVNPDNIVVLLSEKDTYYGRKLADEWSFALANHVCYDRAHVWQFAYLRGLDGSKPQTQIASPRRIPDPTAETALQLGAQQQQQGELADGDAQLDYVVRLADFLVQKDEDLKRHTHGRIVAVGFTGSDAYDKLMLMEELRPRLPEAVFFTTDLDATLWTTKELKFTRHMLVGSAYPLNPFITETQMQHPYEEFAPFRDVYQTAVFRATTQAIHTLLYGQVPDGLDATRQDLQGGLYVIGRHGPVRLPTDTNSLPRPLPDPWNPAWPMVFMAMSTLVCVLVFLAGANGGIKLRAKGKPRGSIKIEYAERKETDRHISRSHLLFWLATVAAVWLMATIFQYWAATTASQTWEEPWNFTEGISIWPSECLRMVAIASAVYFFILANIRRRNHRKKLWEEFFCESDKPIQLRDEWKWYFTYCRQRWGFLNQKAKQAILEMDSYFIWMRSGKPEDKSAEHWDQAKTDLRRERDVTVIRGWIPPFIEIKDDKTKSTEACVNAAALFRSYVHLGRGKRRFLRTCLASLLYFALLFATVYFLRDIPTFLLIRGQRSHAFDLMMLKMTVSATLFVLFYIFDTALLTKRILDYVSRHPTYWPEPTLRKSAIKYNLEPRHLDSVLDVEFAAVQTNEIRPLMFGPLVLLLLLLISRSPCFDNWTWPPGLIVIFVVNFLLVIFYWWIVRRAAEKVKNEAINRLQSVKLRVKNHAQQDFEIPASEEITSGETVKINKDQYLKNLKAIIKQIKNERRGAFAVWFQDPAYLAVFIPSGITGVISLISAYILNK